MVNYTFKICRFLKLQEGWYLKMHLDWCEIEISWWILRNIPKFVRSKFIINWLRSRRHLVLSRVSNPVPLTYEAVVLSMVKPNYTRQPCFKLQSVHATRSCIVWHVKNDAYWDRRFIPRGVHRSSMQILLTCNIFERSAEKSCRKRV